MKKNYFETIGRVIGTATTTLVIIRGIETIIAEVADCFDSGLTKTDRRNLRFLRRLPICGAKHFLKEDKEES